MFEHIKPTDVVFLITILIIIFGWDYIPSSNEDSTTPEDPTTPGRKLANIEPVSEGPYAFVNDDISGADNELCEIRNGHELWLVHDRGEQVVNAHVQNTTGTTQRLILVNKEV